MIDRCCTWTAPGVEDFDGVGQVAEPGFAAEFADGVDAIVLGRPRLVEWR